MNILTQGLSDLFHSTGIYILTVGQVIMILISCILLYLAIVKKFEPLLLLPIAFGMLLPICREPELLIWICFWAKN